MTSLTEAQYQVLMEEPKGPTWREVAKSLWGDVGVVAVATLVILFLWTSFVDVARMNGAFAKSTTGLLILVYVGWVPFFFVIGVLWAYRLNRNDIWRDRLTAKQAEARQLTQRAGDALASSARLVSDLPAALEAARGWLRRAEAEFQERAFGPFWDALEKTASNLEVFRKGVTTVNQNADTFYKALEGHRHSFPSFGPRPEALPDPRPVVEDLQQLVRRGQTDFQFANIWEHRRTREVLIAGFRTLEDGISHLGYAISSSLSDLQSTLSSQLAEIVEQQVALHETVEAQGAEQNRMLDNIQRRRKPFS